MTCKQSLISLFDELLRLFEHGNSTKLIYCQIIHIRHKVRNVYDSDTIFTACNNFYTNHSNRLTEKDISVFNNTAYSYIINVVWSELSPINKSLIWKWVENIIEQIRIEKDIANGSKTAA